MGQHRPGKALSRMESRGRERSTPICLRGSARTMRASTRWLASEPVRARGGRLSIGHSRSHGRSSCAIIQNTLFENKLGVATQVQPMVQHRRWERLLCTARSARSRRRRRLSRSFHPVDPSESAGSPSRQECAAINAGVPIRAEHALFGRPRGSGGIVLVRGFSRGSLFGGPGEVRRIEGLAVLQGDFHVHALASSDAMKYRKSDSLRHPGCPTS